MKAKLPWLFECGNRIHPGPRSRDGFTLIELLAVIAMVAMGTLLLLPALARTRPDTQALQCVNNLKQWGLAMRIYAADNNDGLPRDGFGATGIYPDSVGGTPDDTTAWFNLLPQLIGERTLSAYYNDPGGTPRLRLPFPGGKGPVWHCPAAGMTTADLALVSGGGANGFFSYGMNIDLKKQTTTANFTYPSMPKLAAFAKPAATVLFFDCAFNPRTEVINGSPSFNSVSPANRFRSFGYRHNRGGVIGFLDGHAKDYKIMSVTNNPTSATEPLNPEIIWNAPYRATLP